MSEKTADIDEDIKELKAELKKTTILKEKLAIQDRLSKLYNLRLRYSGTGRGGAYGGSKGSQT